MPRQEKGTKATTAETETALAPENVRAVLQKFDPELSTALAARISDYAKLLLRWNQKISLTSINAPREVLTRHFGESLFGARAAGMAEGSLLDVGSGAGFPALPIAMASPQIQAVLLEPSVKKAAFLSEACRELGLTDRVEVVRARLEDYPGSKPGFDFVTSRAVRLTAEFLEKCGEMLSNSGRLILWLGEEEAASLRKNRDWEWGEPARIPGSERRYVFWGRHNRIHVSRETKK